MLPTNPPGMVDRLEAWGRQFYFDSFKQIGDKPASQVFTQIADPVFMRVYGLVFGNVVSDAYHQAVNAQ